MWYQTGIIHRIEKTMNLDVTVLFLIYVNQDAIISIVVKVKNNGVN